ncbi:MAG: hypothetical protein CVV37_00550 [Nitrospira bacterium HGW-Nitrospira-1]|nr:MAG: hypothetical protein CVV37_00550 [Nitrospira bacterium HGW-Nitrospira-1]
MRTESGSLRKRITLAVTLGMAIILLSFGFVSHYIVEKNIEDSLDKKLVLARLIRNNIDSIIKDNVNRLYDISLSGSVNLNDDNLNPEREALSTAYRYSIFTDGVFLLDKSGNVILNYPEKLKDANINLMGIEPISQTIIGGRPVVSNVYTTEIEKRKVIFVLAPLKDKNGSPVGIAGGEIDPTNPRLAQMFRLINIGQNAVIDIIDSNGVIIASSKPARALTFCEHLDYFIPLVRADKEGVTACDIHKKIHVTSHLEMAPWGVVIQEPEGDVFASAAKLKKLFFTLGLIFVGVAFILTITISRGIIDPITELIKATERIANGELTRKIPVRGSNEIRALGQSFEVMRVKLADSLESIKNHNVELERQVIERTKEIKHSRQKVQNLLGKVITAQEEERKRVARGLHDQTMQSLSAVLIKIEMCKLLDEPPSREKIEEVRIVIYNTIGDLRTIIQNLRPSILDDLGLEAAIRWLMEKHLKGLTYFFNIIGDQGRRFDPYLETTLFRIIQEAIVNIARHAEAENVFVIMKIDENVINLDIEDDGKGFDVRSALKRTEDGRGLGILGMQERAHLLDSKAFIYSEPGCGARISLRIPLKFSGDKYV